MRAQTADPLASIVHRDNAYRVGRGLVKKLRDLIPRQQFKIPIQAAIGARVIASESISALRKDVRGMIPSTTMINQILSHDPARNQTTGSHPVGNRQPTGQQQQSPIPMFSQSRSILPPSMPLLPTFALQVAGLQAGQLREAC